MGQQQIWIADDDADDVLFYRETLLDLGVHPIAIRNFNNGQDLLERLMRPHCLYPSLLLLDGRMPRLNGIEVIKALHGFNRLSYLRVVLLSDSLTDREKSIARTLGVDARVKPVLMTELRQFFKDILKDVGAFNIN